MEGIRQAVFYSARFPAPMGFIMSNQPDALRDIGPCADICQTVWTKRVDISIGFGQSDLTCRAIQSSGTAAQSSCRKRRKCGPAGLHVQQWEIRAKIGDAADIPEIAAPPCHRCSAVAACYRRVGGERFQRHQVVRLARRTRQPVRASGAFFQRGDEAPARVPNSQIGRCAIAACGSARSDGSVIASGHFIGSKLGGASPVTPKVPCALVAPCPTGNLRQARSVARSRIRLPSNLRRARIARHESMSRLRPMPMASVATR